MIVPFENHEEWFENGDSDGWIIVLRDATGKRVANYLNDHNAMAEAEKVKEMAFDSDYAYWLARIAVRDRGLTEDRLNVGDGFQIALTATAAQKAEAFLKALNLWKNA